MSAHDQRLDEAWNRHKQGDLAYAHETYRRMLKDAPEDARVLHYLGLLLHQTGRSQAGLEMLSRSIVLDPRNSRALDHLGQIHARFKRFEAATECFRNALALDPGSVSSMNNLANVLRRQHRTEEALSYYRKALELDPASREAHYNLGKLLRDSGAFEEAMRSFERALAIDPCNHRVCYEMGLCLEELGRFEEAISYYREALKVKPDHSRSLANLISLRSVAPDARVLATAERLSQSERVGNEERAKLHQALGKFYDRQGEFARAFGHFCASNTIQERWRNLKKVQAATAEATSAMTRFDSRHFDEIRQHGHPSRRPVFIVGMPRSGTTLVEQILASHPEVFGAGEQMEIPRIAAQMDVFTPERIQEASARYLEHMGALAGAQVARITDKLPVNYRHLGLIATLFPHAQIIHCTRDPRDVLLSCFIEMFNVRDDDFTNLSGVAHAIVLEHRLMEHWRGVLPLQIHEVAYAELIREQERTTRALLAYCGLPWDERCLSFFSTKRHVETPSRWQVRQPIYRSSEGRWRNYEPHLQPAIAILRAEGVLQAHDSAVRDENVSPT